MVVWTVLDSLGLVSTKSALHCADARIINWVLGLNVSMHPLPSESSTSIASDGLNECQQHQKRSNLLKLTVVSFWYRLSTSGEGL